MFYFSGFWFNNSIWLHWQLVNLRVSCHRKRKGLCQKLLLSSLHTVSVKACVCWTSVTEVPLNNSVYCSVEVWLLAIELSLWPGHQIKEIKVRRRTEDVRCAVMWWREWRIRQDYARSVHGGCCNRRDRVLWIWWSWCHVWSQCHMNPSLSNPSIQKSSFFAHK